MRMIGRCESEHWSTIGINVIIDPRREVLGDYDATSSSELEVYEEVMGEM
jgi:hypothetical protein